MERHFDREFSTSDGGGMRRGLQVGRGDPSRWAVDWGANGVKQKYLDICCWYIRIWATEPHKNGQEEDNIFKVCEKLTA